VKKLKIRFENKSYTVKIREEKGRTAKKLKAWTDFDENNRWTKIVHVYKYLPKREKKHLIAHEIAEGISGIGSKMPAKKRHRKIAPLTRKIKEIIKNKI